MVVPFCVKGKGATSSIHECAKIGHQKCYPNVCAKYNLGPVATGHVTMYYN